VVSPYDKKTDVRKDERGGRILRRFWVGEEGGENSCLNLVGGCFH